MTAVYKCAINYPAEHKKGMVQELGNALREMLQISNRQAALEKAGRSIPEGQAMRQVQPTPAGTSSPPNQHHNPPRQENNYDSLQSLVNSVYTYNGNISENHTTRSKSYTIFFYVYSCKK